MENVYVDFDYYKETFGGTLITDETVFNNKAKVESRYLDIPTFYRLQDENCLEYISDADWLKVKDCICEMIELQNNFDLKNVDSSVPMGIKSQSVEGFSKTYLTPDEIEKIKSNFYKEKNNLIVKRLGTTGLTSRGEY